MRFEPDRHGTHAEDKNKIIEDHIDGQRSVPGDIGTREFLRTLLAARGPYLVPFRDLDGLITFPREELLKWSAEPKQRLRAVSLKTVAGVWRSDFTHGASNRGFAARRRGAL